MNYPPPPQYGAPYGYPAYGPPQDHPQAVTILILGILGLLLCQFLGPVAWVMGKKALNEIDASGGAIGGRGSVQAGYICGIISSVLLILSILFIVVMVILAASGALDSSSSTY
ncbi:DUF4190 domain-containing protein [Nocardia sp. NBC_00565]|uniref:DUF4190 domain-containing protein n=1 Tax=Nocardia sp. NBC_00565 TaxID=2975993 RepID=UPI002E81ECE1|nr:DUF4190 domain-containing protein [Nocardia sp. NBC_00565]WUC02442.1 DUF4190 domain-containing protein [Nocardia sp. NBC_00565]